MSEGMSEQDEAGGGGLLTEEELLRLEEAERAAVPGPWRVRMIPNHDRWDFWLVTPRYDDEAMQAHAFENAAFIQAARDAMPRLLAEVRRLQAEVARLEAWRKEAAVASEQARRDVAFWEQAARRFEEEIAELRGGQEG